MTGGGFDVKDLTRLAQPLAQGAEQLQGLADNTPAMPDAGRSSGAIGAGLASLAEVLSKVTQTAANAADMAQQSQSAYHGVDQSGGQNLGLMRGPR